MIVAHCIVLLVAAFFVAWNGSSAYEYFIAEKYVWFAFNGFIMIWMLLISKSHIDALTEDKGEK